jgi:hypothetical protein
MYVIDPGTTGSSRKNNPQLAKYKTRPIRI